MFVLSPKPSKAEYKSHDGQAVMLGDQEVVILLNQVSTKSGSYERGFKFGSITYGILKKAAPARDRYSYDHGKTWHQDSTTAKKSKGKVIVDRTAMRGEFAFEDIQRINREYDPSFKWKP